MTVDWKSEAKKQVIDQPLHVLWAGVSVGLVVWVLRAEVPTALTIACLIAGISSTVTIIVREYIQWPSSRWWDPPMDYFFFAIGGGLGGWIGTLFP